MRELFDELKPLYEQLHAFVRRRLKQQYGDSVFPASGHIPAHLLGQCVVSAPSVWEHLIGHCEAFPLVSAARLVHRLVGHQIGLYEKKKQKCFPKNILFFVFSVICFVYTGRHYAHLIKIKPVTT